MPHTTDTTGRAWHVEHTEPTDAGIDVHYGYPADASRTGPPRVADTPELVAYLWRVSMQDAATCSDIGRRGVATSANPSAIRHVGVATLAAPPA